MSPVSWGDIFTLLLRGDRIMELRHRRFHRVDKGERAGQNEKASSQVAPATLELLPYTRARVAELADALRSGRSGRKAVEVRVLSRAPFLFPAVIFTGSPIRIDIRCFASPERSIVVLEFAMYLSVLAHTFPEWQPHFSFLDTPHASEMMAMRWLHFIFGIIWIGLLYFFNLVLPPAMKKYDPAL